jgi:glyoxylase-like metal-dependent hydrolase (beta-lactamase superfamily II)
MPSLTPPSMTPEVPAALSPLVRRVIADNPSHMTGPGTNTYLVGVDEVAVIDPGPESKRHTDAIVGGAGRDRIRWILLTHTHADHAPGATRLAKLTGAPVWAYSKREPSVRVDRALADGEVIAGTEFRLETLHTPGHARNHLCFFLEDERMLFTGDTILGGMFSVVSPSTGGDMAAYMATLDRLRHIRRLRAIAPGHGAVIEDPKARIDEYLKHRRDRERQVLRLVQREGPTRVADIVAALYVETPEPLLPVAAKQVYAHLAKLRAEGKVTGRDQRSRWTATAT